MTTILSDRLALIILRLIDLDDPVNPWSSWYICTVRCWWRFYIAVRWMIISDKHPGEEGSRLEMRERRKAYYKCPSFLCYLELDTRGHWQGIVRCMTDAEKSPGLNIRLAWRQITKQGRNRETQHNSIAWCQRLQWIDRSSGWKRYCWMVIFLAGRLIFPALTVRRRPVRSTSRTRGRWKQDENYTKGWILQMLHISSISDTFHLMLRIKYRPKLLINRILRTMTIDLYPGSGSQPALATTVPI